MFSRQWLGRDHVSGHSVKQAIIEGLSPDDQQHITSSARHYGFHATLKAPFALKQGCTADELHQAAECFARKRKPFEAPPLQLSGLSRWIAFTLSAPSPQMDRLAADCVRDFEPYRAPLTDHDLERRRRNGLTPRQDDQLLAFGYPYIFDDFQFSHDPRRPPRSTGEGHGIRSAQKTGVHHGKAAARGRRHRDLRAAGSGSALYPDRTLSISQVMIALARSSSRRATKRSMTRSRSSSLTTPRTSSPPIR